MEGKVVEAVRILYSPQSFPASRKEANRFLESFQDTLDAWTVSMSFLTGSGYPNELALFGAQTIKHKVLVGFFIEIYLMCVCSNDRLYQTFPSVTRPR